MAPCLSMTASPHSYSLEEFQDQVGRFILWAAQKFRSRHNSDESNVGCSQRRSLRWRDSRCSTSLAGTSTNTKWQSVLNLFWRILFTWSTIFLQMRSHWMKSQKESLRLEEAGLTGDVLDSAISSFILEVNFSLHSEALPASDYLSLSRYLIFFSFTSQTLSDIWVIFQKCQFEWRKGCQAVQDCS